MHKEESRTELGTIKIHHNVIASISSIAAMEVEGVKRVDSTLKSGIMELIGKKSLSAIRVEIDKNDEVKVEIPIIISYGFNIADIANKIQENVHSSLEKMTNLVIKDININIQGIEKG